MMKHPTPISLLAMIVVSAFISAARAADPATKPVVADLVTVASRGDLETVKKLLDSGEKPDDARNEPGSTALMRAAFYGHIDVMKLLIAHGANVALETQHVDAMVFAADGGHVEAVAVLLENGADVKHVDEFGNTALYHAIEFGGNHGSKRGGGSVAIAKLLIEKGADVNATFFETRVSALHCAIIKGNKEMVELLIAKGADVNAPSAGGTTPLKAARRRAERTQDEVFTEIARILVEHEAKE